MSRHCDDAKSLFALVAFVLAVFPAGAQTADPQRGFKAGYVALVGSGEVLPEQMDNFKKLAKKVAAAVAEEPGTLVSSSASSQTGRPLIS